MSTASESDECNGHTPDSPSSSTTTATASRPAAPTTKTVATVTSKVMATSKTSITKAVVARSTTAGAVHPLALQGVQRVQGGPGGFGVVRRKGSEWEILGSLEAGTEYSILPKKQEGFLSKKRKWPLKGWHKRYFILENGLLTYGKSAQDIGRGRTHGRIDVGSAVISAKTESLRIDIDDEEFIHHIKVNNLETFGIWLEQLKQHRLFRQHQAINSSSASNSPGEGEPLMSLSEKVAGGFSATSPRSSLPRGARAPSKFQQEFTTMEDNLTTQLLNIQQHAVNLALLTQRAEDEQNAAMGQSGTKAKKLFGLRKKKSAAATLKSNSDQGSVFVAPSSSRSSTLTSEKQAAGTTPVEQDVDSSSGSTLSHMSSSLSASNPSILSGISSVSSSIMATNNATNNNISQLTSSPKQSSNSRPVSLPSEVTSKSNKMALGSSLSVASNSSTLTAASNSNTSSESSSISKNTVAMDQLMPSTREEIMAIAQEIHVDVSNLLRSFTADRDRLKASLEVFEFTTKSSTMGNSSQVAVIASLRQSLNAALQQNSLMRARLQKIHLDSETSDLPQVPSTTVDTLTRDMKHSLSYSSSCISEFFDAREYGSDQQAPSVYSSESEETGSNPSDTDETSDDDQNFVEAMSPSALVTNAASKDHSPFSLLASSPTQTSSSLATTQNVSSSSPIHSKLTEMTGRRQKLPVPKTETEGINLWNLLCKNIGKDLSKISMPVTLNEPLSALQRLCEELEYSELLDKAASADTELQRMTWVAAFAVSVYGSCQARAGHKPFNPLLGETFECVREDRGFRYVAEQVSHHPPVSACHASAINSKWTWEQDLRVKTKFWGKSMEFQPLGSVRVVLNGNEVYEWNKITTCIHNLFGGSDRWVDLYGQCVIKAKRLTARIDFAKASYWSNKRHEIYGTIVDNNEQVQQHLFGKWSEALYCGKAPSSKCIWRPAILPADSDLYYGFSRFAIELNELTEHEKHVLPITDTRFRPDQRLLEEGQITEAENMKLKLEQNQRERRHEMEARDEKHQPKWFVKINDEHERWQFNQRYWKVRSQENHQGFISLNLDQLW